VPNNGDCGAGVREGTCNDQMRKLKCKVPCNWKKEFGGRNYTSIDDSISLDIPCNFSKCRVVVGQSKI
jgi:hypothetical protein